MKIFLIGLFAFSLSFGELPKFLGDPVGHQGDQKLDRRGYTIAYASEFKQARWVSYKLSPNRLGGKVVVVKKFRQDQRLKGKKPEEKDYKGSGYNMGYLVPPKDMKWSGQALNEVYMMSNTTPQKPFFRKLTWTRLEEKVRAWVKKEGELLVITGSVLEWGMQTIGENKVIIPDYFYKIILKKDEKDLKAIAFLAKNERTSKTLKQLVVPIDSIETLTGLDFFPRLDDRLEKIIETEAYPKKWKF